MEELIELLKNIAPQVWEILIRQVYVDAFSYMAWSVVLAIASILLGKHAKYFFKKYQSGNEWNDYDFPAILLAIVAVVSTIIAVMLLFISIKEIINPEFYAIQYLINAVP